MPIASKRSSNLRSSDRHAALPGALAATAGLLVATQGRVNGALGTQTGNPLLAATVSLAVGLVALGILVLTRPTTRTALAHGLPQAIRVRSIAWWQLLGGLGGAFLVTTQSTAVPELGVALYTVLIVAGTTSSSLAFDSWGLAPGGRRPITPTRAVGALGTTMAIVIAVWGRQTTGSIGLAALVMTVTAGILTTFQQAVNGQVAAKTGDALAATTVNFALAFVAVFLGLIIKGAFTSTPLALPPAPWSHPLLWSGGLLGVGFILLSASVVRPLGVLLYSLLSISGQLCGSLVLDLVAPSPGTHVGPQLVAGVVLTGLAVGLTAVRG